jgi:hypothetical protein
MRKLLGGSVLLLGSVFLVSTVGCGPSLSKEELGTVTFEMPKVDEPGKSDAKSEKAAPVDSKETKETPAQTTDAPAESKPAQ